MSEVSLPYAIKNWSGGMVDHFDREVLSENQSVYIENMEYRDGILRTRRGSWMLYEGLSGESYQGSGIFKSDNLDEKPETQLIAQGQKIYAISFPGGRAALSLPTTLEADDEVEFVQGFNKMYIFRGDGKAVWSWSGNPTEAVTALSTPSILSPFPGSDRITYAYNRFWIATDRDTLNISDALEERVDLTNNSIEISDGDGERIVGMHQFRDNTLLVYKTKSIYMILNANTNITNASNDLLIEKIDNTFGCVAKDTIINIGNDQWFLSRQGFTTVSLNEQNKTRLTQVTISDPIKNLMKRINWAQVHKASSVHHDNYYITALPIDNSPEPNVLLAYDFINGSWIGVWRLRDSTGALDDSNGNTIFELRKLGVFTRFNQDHLFTVGSTGEILCLLTSDQQDFVPNYNYCIDMNNTSTSTISAANVYTATDIATQTAGMIHLLIDYYAHTPNGSVFAFYENGTSNNQIKGTLVDEGSSTVRFYVECVDSSGGTDWKIKSNTILTSGSQYMISIVHDGTSPSMFINNQSDFTTSGSQPTPATWFSGLTSLDRFAIGQALSGSADFRIYYFGVYKYTGTDTTSGKADVIFYFPFNEGTGTTTTEEDNFLDLIGGGFLDLYNGKGSLEIHNPLQGLLNGASLQWCSVSTPANIHTDYISTPIHSSSESDKQGQRGEIRFVYKNPKLSIKALSPQELAQTQLEVNEKTFQKDKYFTDLPLWNKQNVNRDHNDPHRENYSPVTIDQGIYFDTEGLYLNYENEKTERFNLNKTAQRFHVRVQNTQGTIGIKSIAGVLADKGALKIRSA